MKRFKNILAVYNNVVGDDDTLTRAAALAKENDARLTVIEVIKESAVSSSSIAEREKHLSRLAVSIQQKGIRVGTIVLAGTPFLEIIQQVLREKHDLVITVAEGGGYKNLLFGSTSMHLMRKCPCPVWVTKPRGGDDYTRILAAVDPSREDVEVNELNFLIMDLASSLAFLHNSELFIIHAWELTGHDLDTVRSETTVEIRDGLLRKHELMHRKPLERLLGRYALKDLEHRVHLVKGDPVISILELVDKEKVDLVVMGTICRTGIPGFFIGNTAEMVLREVNCAVLTVKPEGFVTPITLED